MWVPKQVIEWFQISKDSIDTQRADIAALRVERDSLHDQLAKQTILSDWLRLQVNQLQAERSGLLEKAYGILVPTPQIKQALNHPGPTMDDFSFDDVGEEVAKKLGFISHPPLFPN